MVSLFSEDGSGVLGTRVWGMHLGCNPLFKLDSAAIVELWA